MQPSAFSVHDEREVLTVVIRVISKDVEHHTAEQFLAVHFRQMQLTANGKGLFVRIRFWIHCRQCLRVQFPRFVAVKTLGEEVIHAIHFKQSLIPLG